MTDSAKRPSTSDEVTPATDQGSAHMGRGLNPVQLDYLTRPLDERRVKFANGQSHVEAWDVRRWLNRIFGFGGWSYATDMVLVREIEITPQAPNGRSRWTVIYRAKCRLEVRDPQGNPLAFFEEFAAGDSANQPALGDAHDNAMKTAESQALKRCAVNLGDQFGLSLYANGTTQAVVQRTLDHAPAPAPSA
ncbi:Rad52/Rad22 family DNA repair protein [Streptomyces alboflavus]|uniref:Rad52/Rad22 family DNA repair protein n=1 Tax=Streptomyces alboflavus TaxID=67267 RepID=UPI00369BD66A